MTRNAQAPEKQVRADKLSIHSIFYTIQGEGPFCGTPAVFIRLAGCNLQCPACDTDYTSKRTDMRVVDIITTVDSLRPADTRPNRKGLVVITGGEPFRQDLNELIPELIHAGYYVQVETNGTLPAPVCTSAYFNVDASMRHGFYIVVSPKAGRVHPETARFACAYKYVMGHDSIDPDDGLPVLALDHTAFPRVARPPEYRQGMLPIYLQPRDDGGNVVSTTENLKACIQSCMKHGYILQLQVHKIIGLE